MDEQVFRALLEEFYLECKERLDRIEQVLLTVEAADAERRRELLVEAKRELHTLKGNSGMMGLGELQALGHGMEDQVGALSSSRVAAAVVRELLAGVDEFRVLLDRACGREDSADAAEEEAEAPALQESVRVSFAALDSLVDLLSEMVIFRNRLAEGVGAAPGALPQGRSRGARRRSTSRCARRPARRWGTWCATPSCTGSNRRRSVSPRARRRPGASVSRRGGRAGRASARASATGRGRSAT